MENCATDAASWRIVIFGFASEGGDLATTSVPFVSVPGFIEGKLRYAGEIFDCDTAAKQNAARARRLRSRPEWPTESITPARKAMRHDEHSHGAIKRVWDGPVRGQQKHNKHNRTQRKCDPGVITAERIGESLCWRLLLLRTSISATNAIERALLQRRGRMNDCLAVEIKCAAADRIADLFQYRNCFAGQRGFIGGCRSFNYHAIDWKKFARL